MRGCCSMPAIASSARARSICSRTRRTSKPSSLSRGSGLHQAFEQFAKLARPPEVLGMPLHGDAERAIRLFHRLDHAVRRRCRHFEPGGDFLYRLVMAAVDVAGLAILHVIGEQGCETRAFGHPDFVGDVDARLWNGMFERAGDLAGDVL